MTVDRPQDVAIEEERDSLYGGDLLTLGDVTVAYPGEPRSALDGISLSLHQGESVLILGASGSGKSTLALLVAGLIPEVVEARVGGTVRRSSALQKPGRVGMVFQDPETQLAMLEVGDEVAFGLENLRVASAEMGPRIHGALRQRGLPIDLRIPHSTFSGGMKQRLALAAVWSMDPELLIADEPTANLDPLESRRVFEELARVARSGKTLIVIEHRFDPLLPFMDRVVLMEPDGRMHRTGPTSEVISEEWDWMKRSGILPPWRSRPGQGGGDRARTLTALSVHEADDLPLERRVAVSVREACLAYGGRKVWDHVNVSVPAGSFTAIVGPNGAGKTSLLMAMAGLVKPDGGQIEVLGRVLRDWPRRDLIKRLTFSFQNPEYQFIHERVADELAGRRVGDRVPEDVQSDLSELGLLDAAARSPFSLSQGQKRRLSVAAMLKDPHDLYLFDEPTFGQDPATQEALLEKLSACHRHGGTVILSTHDMDLVRTWATYVIVLAEGGVRYEGPTEDLFARPDLMRQAHLIDDLTPLDLDGDREPLETKPVAENGGGEGSSGGGGFMGERRSAHTTVSDVNPAVQLITAVIGVILAMGVRSIPQGLGLFLLVTGFMLGFARLTPLQIVKRMAPFLIFYVLYVWTLTAYAAVPPGTPTFDILWYRLSWPGFVQGLVLALRMLSAVGLGVYILSVIDITETVVSFCQNLGARPKFAYGLLAGLRYLPLFQTEWAILRRAHQLRGREGSPVLRPVVFALPLLSQAVRMAERAAIAMEARGFRGEAADNPKGRTYYRPVSLTWSDIAFGAQFDLAIAVLLWILR